MSAQIIPKKSTVAAKVPLGTDLADGEICINLTDGIIYSKHTDGSIVSLSGALELHTHTISQITGLQDAIDAANEIFIGGSAPAPADYRFWLDTTDDTLQYHDGSVWVPISGAGGGGGSSILVQPTEPSSPSTGDAWLDTGTTYELANLYELAVANGFVGTEQDYLDSLKGEAATIAVGTTSTLSAGSNATVTNTGTSGDAVFDFSIPQGIQGDAATISVGTTSTGLAGTNASVANSGTSGAAVFDFTIPRGDQGIQGEAATVAAGSTTTGNAGTSASVVNSGTVNDAVFDFTIPKGDTGDPGITVSATAPASPVEGDLWLDIS